jgi:hypothetical protein
MTRRSPSVYQISPLRLVPEPILAWLEGMRWISLDGGREIALLAVTVHKQDRRNQLAGDLARIKDLSRI